MSEWKAIKNIEKVQPDGFEASGRPKPSYYVIHYEDGTSDEADFIFEHDEEDFEEDIDDGDEPVISKEELLRDLDEALHELKLSLEGKVKMKTWEEFLAELDSEEDEC